jgi:hypothetical protein
VRATMITSGSCSASCMQAIPQRCGDVDEDALIRGMSGCVPGLGGI